MVKEDLKKSTREQTLLQECTEHIGTEMQEEVDRENILRTLAHERRTWLNLSRQSCSSPTLWGVN
jgi:hypothetical protein